MREFTELAEGVLDIALQQRLTEAEDLVLRGQAEHGEDVRLLDFIATKADQLVKRGFRVAHPAVGAAGDGKQRGLVNLHLFQPGDVRQVFDNERGGDAAQVKSLAAGKDGGQHFLRVGGGEQELHMRGRLLEGLEQRVKSRRGEHVNFVNDVDFVRSGGRRVFAGLAEFAHLFHAVVAGPVDLDHIERPAFGDFEAAGIVIAEVHLGSAGAVQAFGEDAGDGGFARAARPAKQVGMGDALLFDGVGKRLRDMLLPDDIGKPLGPVFPRNDLITHENQMSG